MAKLENVKVIDMVGGEITKVAYDGVEYVKVDDVKNGDIAVIVDAWSDLTNGEYYFVNYVSKWDDGDIFVGITRCRYLRYVGYDRNMNYFRKVSTETSLDITSIDERVDSLEKRVDAMEEKPAQKLKAGDFVTIDTSRYVVDITEGKTYNVLADRDGYLYFLDDEGDKRWGPIRNSAYTIVESPKPTFKTGDIVVITANTNASRNAVGDIGKVGEYKSERGADVDIPGKTSGNGNFTLKSEMRHATPAEREQYEDNLKQAEKDAVFTKIGRKPGEFKKGDIVRLIKTDGNDALQVGTIFIVTKTAGDLSSMNLYFKEGPTLKSCVLSKDCELIAPVESRLDKHAGTVKAGA